MDNIKKDDRFAHIIKDPKFRRIPKNERKVKIDKRFQSMFKDKKFSVNFTVDKRGKPIIQSSSENLRKYYDLSDSEEDKSSNTDSEESKEIYEKPEIKEEESTDEEKDVSSQKSMLKNNEKQLHLKKKNENTNIPQNIKKKLKNMAVDYARGEGLLMSGSSSDEESLCESDNDEEINHDWGEFDKDAEETVESTYRLAACNMDWDNIRAVDLMVSLHSFLPSGGVIHSVTIYPSEFGMKRMNEEEINGPSELVNDCSQEFNEENEEGSTYHMEKLRQYQLNRLKYYYAVIVCDSSVTAEKLWSECRNFEYEASGIKYDLRFIPDDMEFDQTPKEVCDKLPDFSKYEPRIFTTTALQQEKVDLTWDETNIERKELTKKINSGKLDDLNENHLKHLLASGSSEDESEGDNVNENADDSTLEGKGSAIQKYKLLLKSIEEKEKSKEKNDVELECTWGINVAEETELRKDKKSATLTPFEEYLEKRKIKRKIKRKSKTEEKMPDESSEDDIPSDIDMNDSYFADELKNCKSKTKKGKKSRNNKMSASSDDENNDELELVLMDKDEHENKQHFNMKQIEENESASKSKKKRLKRKNKDLGKTQDDTFEVNVKDPRFDALFSSHHFNIDPADSHFRKTKATEALLNEKLKRRNVEIKSETKTEKQEIKKQINSELTALVKSVKQKINKN